MKIGLIGLGKMGNAVASRLLQAKYEVIGFDLNSNARQEAQELGVQTTMALQDIPMQARVIWLMVPAGEIVDTVLQMIKAHLQPGDIVVDGGNSKFTDSITRAHDLQKMGVAYLDCGTSGGLLGQSIGFSLMVGGDKDAYNKIEPILKVLAAPNGYGYMGPSGTGHYVKMIHNGIEYGLLEAYAEGFSILRNGHYKDLDLAQITRIWNNGSVIRSWILELAHQTFKEHKNLDTISGEIEEGGTGRWTMQEAQKHNIPVPVIEEAVAMREWSRATGGNYGTKIVALLRHAFGGHDVKSK